MNDNNHEEDLLQSNQAENGVAQLLRSAGKSTGHSAGLSAAMSVSRESINDDGS